MPYHVSSEGQESKCQVDVSQKKYKIGQYQPTEHGQNHGQFSCPSEDTWYGVILWVLRVRGQGINQSARISFTRVFCVVTPY